MYLHLKDVFKKLDSQRLCLWAFGDSGYISVYLQRRRGAGYTPVCVRVLCFNGITGLYEDCN